MTAQPSQLQNLARPFDSDLVERRDGNSYVSHEAINQMLLYAVGPFDFETVQLIRGNPEAKGKRAEKLAKGEIQQLTDVVVGGVFRLTVTIDGRTTRVEEIGEVEDPYNWAHDGLRAKMAASDGIKRCAMRLGLGLHLWAEGAYFLDKWLTARTNRANELADSLTPRSQVEALLREHGRTWEQLAEIMTTTTGQDVTVDHLKGVNAGSQVAAIRDALAAHSAEGRVA